MNSLISWVYKKRSDMNPLEYESAISNIIRERDILFNVYSGAVDRAITSLFLINGGGVVCMVTYIYNNDNPLLKSFLNSLLFMFLCGLSSALILVTYDYVVTFCLNNKFGKESRLFERSKLAFNGITRFNNGKNACMSNILGVYVPMAIGAFSFIFAIIALIRAILFIYCRPY